MKFQWLAFALVILAGAVVRFWGLGEASLWLDEAASVQFAGLPWSTLWLTGYDNAPPLYYSVLKVVLSVSDSEFAVRLPSVVFGVLTISVVYWAGLLVAGAWGALAAALVFALSAAQVEYSQEARAYSLLVLALALALVGLLWFFRQEMKRDGATDSGVARSQQTAGLILYALGILIALYTHNIAVFFVLVAQLAFAFHWTLNAGDRVRLAVAWLVANGVVFLLWLPWLYIILTELLGNGSLAWLSQAGAEEALQTWRDVQGFAFVWRGQPWLDISLGVLCLIGAYRLRRKPSVVVVLLLVSVLGPLLIWLIGYVQPIYMEKSIIWSFLGTAILIGAGVSVFKAPYGLLVMLLLGLISARSATSFNALGFTQDEDWRSGFAAWRQQIIPGSEGEAALFCSPSVAVGMLYYARKERELPPLLAWGSTDDGAGIALLLDRSGRSLASSQRGWLAEIPHDLFLWKRGNIDEGRRLLPPLPEQGRWREPVWRRLSVVFSHCPEDSLGAL
ncbi:MAG: glycosyltransferase family 39 protein, partial [Chromatiaceae bacterium]